MSRAAVLCLVGLAGCAGGPAAVRTVTVNIPVAEACVPDDLPRAPVYPDADKDLLSAPDAAERYRLLVLGREVRMARTGLLESVVAACKESPIE